MIGSPSRRSGSGRETPLVVRKWSGVPPGGPEVVERPARLSGSGREAFPEKWKQLRGPPEIRKWSGGPTRGPQMVENPSRRTGSGRETLPEV